MTAPIKPKGPTATNVGATNTPSVDKASGAFRSELDAAKGVQSHSLESPWASIAKEIKAGKLTRVEVVDSLVDKQLSSPMAKALPPVERARLEATLRDALDNDPTLAGLLAEAGLSQ